MGSIEAKVDADMPEVDEINEETAKIIASWKIRDKASNNRKPTTDEQAEIAQKKLDKLRQEASLTCTIRNTDPIPKPHESRDPMTDPSHDYVSAAPNYWNFGTINIFYTK